MRQLCLSSGLKATVTSVILLSQDSFESDSLETKFQTITSLSQFEKVTVQTSFAELWTVISNQIISINLPTRGSIKLIIINMTHVERYR